MEHPAGLEPAYKTLEESGLSPFEPRALKIGASGDARSPILRIKRPLLVLLSYACKLGGPPGTRILTGGVRARYAAANLCSPWSRKRGTIPRAPAIYWQQLGV